ncbi:hypothetical protein [Rhizobium sp. FKL33]|jgi:hypothetical protein|nr:hypothetical protein [Rhizobium sp. FKL33]
MTIASKSAQRPVRVFSPATALEKTAMAAATLAAFAFVGLILFGLI